MFKKFKFQRSSDPLPSLLHHNKISPIRIVSIYIFLYFWGSFHFLQQIPNGYCSPPSQIRQLQLPHSSLPLPPPCAYFGKINYDISTKRAIVHCADTEIFAGYQMTPPTTRARAANLIYVEFTSEDEMQNAKCAAAAAKAAVIRQRNLEEIRSHARPSCFNSTV